MFINKPINFTINKFIFFFSFGNVRNIISICKNCDIRLYIVYYDYKNNVYTNIFS